MRTDQLDGETDWKLRIAVASCQALARDEVCSEEEGLNVNGEGLMRRG